MNFIESSSKYKKYYEAKRGYRVMDTKARLRLLNKTKSYKQPKHQQ
jgi:hypothetical protein